MKPLIGGKLDLSNRTEHQWHNTQTRTRFLSLALTINMMTGQIHAQMNRRLNLRGSSGLKY